MISSVKQDIMEKWQFSMDPVQEWGEEEDNGAVFGITLRRDPVVPSPESPDLPTVFSFSQYHTVKLRRLKAASLDRLISHLLDHENQEADFARVFLSTYRAFTSSTDLIELLFQRDESMVNSDNAVCTHSGLSPLVRLWLEEFSEDLHEPPQYPSLKLLGSKLKRRVCFRRLAQKAENLLKRLQERDCSQLSSLQLNDPYQEDVLDCSGKDKTLLDFPVRKVAEQLTRLDAELFVKVKPYHCLGCVWSQRDKKENRNLAPTVRATISQFNAVTNCVITSLLCPATPSSSSSPNASPRSSMIFVSSPSSSPRPSRSSHTNCVHRAHVIERWIAVAQECRELKNFSSLRAILSALQSNAVYRLKKTWAAVSRESLVLFEHLCENFPDENFVLRSREILADDGSAIPGSKSPQLNPRNMAHCSGIVPYLGTYLTFLTMLDTALNDTVEGGLINFEKRRRECEILTQIQQLQASCSLYSFTVDAEITNWLQGHSILTDQESYDLSRELEPPVDPCPSSPNLWGHRLRTKKITLLRSGSDRSSQRTCSDQISVCSSGSSSSDLEELNVPNPYPLRLKLKSLSGSLHNVAEDLSMCPSLSSSSGSSSQPDLSLASLDPSPDSHSLGPSDSLGLSDSLGPSDSPGPSRSSHSPQLCFNKQVDDSCIIRVSVESISNGNIYKSILLTSQDHTPQVVQRALEKHNMEELSCNDFAFYQMLSNGKELHIPDKANVFYAMCPMDNYNFVLRPRWKNHQKRFGSPSSSRSNHKTRCSR
ncbi:ral guanine nucleotide dissociation stimulator-like 1 isoform X2 [Periophthalmus magnuspinnatus]|uniref:ral guanine nucleotide dissociation stimulator-like 1 isoform X2 n=1 Tax=Periophthalmus magnuspinnatus TaxID=409849 RepID=UPI00145B851F|nr:ral guanine nucleotide dissociation stimulator-like 1 isoform X2 [Periophthalmus magnuspinnatus]